MSFPSSPYRTPKRGSPASRRRSPPAYLCPLPCARRPESQRAPRTRRVGIELFQERRRNILDYLDLPCGQVLPPASRLRLAPLLALALLLFRYVLPGVFLHRARKLGHLHGDVQLRVDALHRLQGICAQVLVTDHCLPATVGPVGLPGLLYLLHVGVRAHPHVDVRVPGLLRRTPVGFRSLREPASLATGVHTRGDNVPGVPDQEDHTALREGFHEQRRAYRAVWLLYDQVAALVDPG